MATDDFEGVLAATEPDAGPNAARQIPGNEAREEKVMKGTFARSRGRSGAVVFALAVAAVLITSPTGASAKEPEERSPAQLMKGLENLSDQCAKHDSTEKCATELDQFNKKFGDISAGIAVPPPDLVCPGCGGDDGGGSGPPPAETLIRTCGFVLGGSLWGWVCSVSELIRWFCVTIAPAVGFILHAIGAAQGVNTLCRLGGGG